MILTSVDLPAPLSPSSATTSPARDVEAHAAQRFDGAEIARDVFEPEQRDSVVHAARPVHQGIMRSRPHAMRGVMQSGDGERRGAAQDRIGARGRGNDARHAAIAAFGHRMRQGFGRDDQAIEERRAWQGRRG